MTINCTNRNWSHGRVRGTEALSVNDAKRKVNINRAKYEKKKNDGTGGFKESIHRANN